ncbi:hypothetical protein CC2G_000024 [Coprinopsis cinerea AmutBmut pab1-1]|nr:hypothetical protein CC2G_000024 [Coprinopsis cinerea AmutBmut pab1-1]
MSLLFRIEDLQTLPDSEAPHRGVDQHQPAPAHQCKLGKGDQAENEKSCETVTIDQYRKRVKGLSQDSLVPESV